MKKNYLTPQITVITIDNNSLLAGSIRDTGTYADQSDAPVMINIPEDEPIANDHEE